jgi:release factor H-coupled RctB family protein
MFYPYLVGSDVGCGMALFDTDLDAAKAKPEKWAKKLKGLEEPWDGDITAWLKDYGVEPDGFGSSLGTIGMGNHFAELLKVKEVFDEHYFRFCGLKRDVLFLLVHSGSRGLGERLLRSHVDVHRDGGLMAGGEEAERYLQAHDNCVKWAQANRYLIACRLIWQIDSWAGVGHSGDWCHNSITLVESEGKTSFLHRKGAAPSDEVCVIIPGSRGACSYLVKPIGDQEANLWSVAHGAGRKWGRNECEGRLREKYSADSMRKTKLGSFVICEDKDLLYEEAPQAYKDIDAVIADMVGFGLVKVVATFTPILTYKVRGK